MHSTLSGARRPVAASSLFDTWTTYDWRDGVVVDHLSPHDRLVVRTRNSIYEIIVTVPQTAEVLVRGGAFFREFTAARVAGSSLGGTFLKLHGVYKGFQLELVSESGPVVTTRIAAVSLVPAAAGAVM